MRIFAAVFLLHSCIAHAGMSKLRSMKGVCWMSENESKSDVARLMQQIEREYEAAIRGLTGFAGGSSKHAFITARMERMAACHETLTGLVGEHEAGKVLPEALEGAKEGGEAAVSNLEHGGLTQCWRGLQEQGGGFV